MPCPFTLQVPKCFVWSKFFEPAQKFIYILCQTKRCLHSVKLVLVPAQKFLEEALNAVKFLGWLKKFGPAILGPVKGQGII